MLASGALTSVLMIAHMMLSGSDSNKIPKACTLENYGQLAYVMARSSVKDRLNDPGSARFSLQADQINVDTETCVFSIRSEFSAKNGFGGRIRSVFTARMMRHEDDSWSTLYLDVR